MSILYPDKNIDFLLPSNYKTGIEEREKKLVRELLPKYLALRLLERTNKGDKTAILVSSCGGDGCESSIDHYHNLVAASGLKFELEKKRGKFSFRRKVDLVERASSEDLRQVVQDTDFENIFVVGHADYHTWVASDGPVNWHDLGKMTDGHLKRGVFANVGCAEIRSWNMIPLGYFVVSNPGNLIGYEAEHAYTHTMGDLSRLKQLRGLPRLELLV